MSDELTKLDHTKQELSKEELQSRLRQDGRFWSLLSIVKELALREGLTQEEFYHHFQHRQNFYHDNTLKETKDLHPFSVDALYDLPPSEALKPASYPPLPFENLDKNP